MGGRDFSRKYSGIIRLIQERVSLCMGSGHLGSNYAADVGAAIPASARPLWAGRDGVVSALPERPGFQDDKSGTYCGHGTSGRAVIVSGCQLHSQC